MNTNPSAKTILCYGDSNTFGQRPDTRERFSSDVRWTGVLQNKLGGDYYVIEEGLSSRTTNLEFSAKQGRNGKTYLDPCLNSHAQLDAVVVMLGTNDFKIQFNRSAAETATALQELIDIINAKTPRFHDKPAHIVLVSPILIDDTAPKFEEFCSKHYNHDSAVKSQQLAAELKRLAAANSYAFIDAAIIAQPGVDGIHLDLPSHKRLGEQIAKTIQELGL